MFKENQLIPLLYAYSGELLAIDLNELKQSPKKAYVYYCQVWDGEQDKFISIYDNIYLTFETFTTLYQRDIFYYKERELDMDFDEYYTLSGSLNPKSEYWR